MTAPAFVQSATASGNGSATVTLNGVTAGNTILVAVTQAASGTRTYSATNYTSEVANNGNGRVAAILRRFSCPAGTNSITVNANTGTLAILVTAIEVEPLELVSTGSSTDPTTQTTHDCASTGLDVSIDALLFGVGVLTASGGTVTPASGYSSAGTGTGQMVQYRRSDAGVVADKATWSSTNTRQGTNVLAAYKSPAGGTTYSLGNVDSRSVSVSGVDAVSLVLPLANVDSRSSTISGADGLSVSAGLANTDSRSVSVSGADALAITAGLGNLDSRSVTVSHASDVTLVTGGTTYDLGNVDSRSVTVSARDAISMRAGLANVDSRSATLSDMVSVALRAGLGNLDSRSDSRSGVDAVTTRVSLANRDSRSETRSGVDDLTLVGAAQEQSFFLTDYSTLEPA
jgi:hypothetical protein